jgi:hypothetical protein
MKAKVRGRKVEGRWKGGRKVGKDEEWYHKLYAQTALGVSA